MKNMSVERLKEVLDYDPATGEFTRKTASLTGKYPPGAALGYSDGYGYRCIDIDRVQVRCHRAAWAIYYGEWPEMHIDHINRNGSDNRIENLRLATISQNSMNTVRKNTSGRKGVSMSRGKYRANIFLGGQHIHLGVFENLDEAAHAYNKAAIAGQGEFAVLNPVGVDYE